METTRKKIAKFRHQEEEKETDKADQEVLRTSIDTIKNNPPEVNTDNIVILQNDKAVLEKRLQDAKELLASAEGEGKIKEQAFRQFAERVKELESKRQRSLRDYRAITGLTVFNSRNPNTEECKFIETCKEMPSQYRERKEQIEREVQDKRNENTSSFDISNLQGKELHENAKREFEDASRSLKKQCK